MKYLVKTLMYCFLKLISDEVGFGERVDAPPTITAKPRKSQVSDSMFKVCTFFSAVTYIKTSIIVVKRVFG